MKRYRDIDQAIASAEAYIDGSTSDLLPGEVFHTDPHFEYAASIAVEDPVFASCLLLLLSKKLGLIDNLD